MDTTVSAGPTTDPTQLLELAEGMHAIEVVAATVGWLDLFEWLADRPSDAKAIAAAFSLAHRPTRVMLTLLQSLNLIEPDDAGVYSLTQLAREYLLRSSPWNVVPVFAALKDRPACGEMLGVLRTGRPMSFGADGGGDWASSMDDEMFAEFFLQAIDSRNAYLAHAMAKQLDQSGFRRLLDVGGGSGIYSCALARENPSLHATVLERPPVDAVARRAIERRELADRVDVVGGDMLLDGLPSGYDVHLFSNVLHDWDDETVSQLLLASFRSLEPGGRVVVHDALLDGAGPLAVAQYSVLLMAFTAGRCYSRSEVRDHLSAAGFVDIAYQKTVAHRDLVTAARP